MKIGHTIRR